MRSDHPRCAVWLLGAALVCPAASSAATINPEHDRPTLAIGVESGARELVLDPGEPLLIELRLRNDLAGAVANENARRRRWLEESRQSPSFLALDAATRERLMRQLQPVELPRFEIGTASRPLLSLLRIQVGPTGEGALPVSARPLAAARRVPARVVLVDDVPVTVVFGLDAEVVAALPAGEQTLWAELDTRGAEGMWQGLVRSPPLHIRLGERGGSDADEPLRSFLRAGYYLADERFAEATNVADRLTAAHPEFIGGWLRKGDAAAGLGQLAEAAAAFERALVLFYQQNRAVPGELFEHPEYTLRRLYEVEAAAEKAREPE